MSKYLRPCPYPAIDVYRVLEIFEVTDPAIQHAVKKLLFAGKRGAKNKATDIRETIIALERWEKMRDEESMFGPPVTQNLSPVQRFSHGIHEGTQLCYKCGLSLENEVHSSDKPGWPTAPGTCQFTTNPHDPIIEAAKKIL